jgi:hypothetical protein
MPGMPAFAPDAPRSEGNSGLESLSNEFGKVSTVIPNPVAPFANGGEGSVFSWQRERKIWLIERQNLTRQDFAEDFAKSKSGSLTAVPTKRGRVREDNAIGKYRPNCNSRSQQADPSPPSPQNGAGFGMTAYLRSNFQAIRGIVTLSSRTQSRRLRMAVRDPFFPGGIK